MPFAVFHHTTRALSFKSRPVRDLNNPALSARLALPRHVWVFSLEACKSAILVWAARIVDLLNVRLSFVKGATLRPRSLPRTILRAISLICVRRRDLEVSPASEAIAPRFCRLFSASSSSGAAGTCLRAVAFIGPDRLKSVSAVFAKEIIHTAIMP